MGAIRFAQETNQTLTDFFSEDSAKVGASAIDKLSNLKHIANISDDMQKMLWNQSPSSTDKHIAGKLSLCLGLPIMIHNNYATELCIT